KRSNVLYCNNDNLSKDNSLLPCVKYTPLEFAPDGKIWLSLGFSTNEPYRKDDIFGIHNITKGEIITYDMQTDQWTTQKMPTLSSKERVILLLLSQGQTVLVVAQRLGMSENTVATHRKNIFRKLGAHTVAEAMAFAVKYKAI
uniref:helix-turn-helix transcriptional regulator n=1 Tax=Prevotella sp. TaxID=59823 RepID=UPI004027D998